MNTHMHRWLIIQTVIGAVASVVHAGGPVEDPPVAGNAIVKVEVGSTIEAAITEIESQLPGVTFAVSDDSLAARRLYLLSYTPAQLIGPVEAVLELIKDDPTNKTAEWAEILYEGHDPESNTGSLWFHSVSGVDFYSNQYASTMLGLPTARPDRRHTDAHAGRALSNPDASCAPVGRS